jgi:Tfp pilus assembly protein FimT
MSATGERSDAGFTLLEALVSVAVTVMIAAIVVPRLDRSLRTLAVRYAAGVLVSDLRRARAHALSADEPTMLAVAPDGRSYAWTGGESRLVTPAARLDASGPVTFFADGSATGAIITATSGGRTIQVGINPATGAISTAGA